MVLSEDLFKERVWVFGAVGGDVAAIRRSLGMVCCVKVASVLVLAGRQHGNPATDVRSWVGANLFGTKAVGGRR